MWYPSCDQINAAFELGGTIATVFSIRRLMIDKHFAGVSIIPWFFFATWGFWNLFYYFTMQQYMSMVAAAGMALVNTTWLGLAFIYGKQENATRTTNCL